LLCLTTTAGGGIASELGAGSNDRLAAALLAEAPAATVELLDVADEVFRGSHALLLLLPRVSRPLSPSTRG